MLKAAILMGSDSDIPVVKPCLEVLKKFNIKYEVRIMSAHRTPAIVSDFAVNARANGFGVIIAAAGKAAHLAGVVAGHTTLPVIGIPIKSSALDGLDALLSTVQMPSGVPVAVVAIDGSANAGILAAQIISLTDARVADKLAEYKNKMADEVIAKDKKLAEEDL